jgi:metal-responsive CopG/Arc/MetJ family transcriptional regulator
MASPTTMISLNVPTQTLSGFDRLCRLVGKSRTAVIIDLMRGFVLADSGKIINEVKRIARISNIGRNTSKIVSEGRLESKRRNQSSDASTGSNKCFSDFLPRSVSVKARG